MVTVTARNLKKFPLDNCWGSPKGLSFSSLTFVFIPKMWLERNSSHSCARVSVFNLFIFCHRVFLSVWRLAHETWRKVKLLSVVVTRVPRFVIVCLCCFVFYLLWVEVKTSICFRQTSYRWQTVTPYPLTSCPVSLKCQTAYVYYVQLGQ